ncbi:MAG: hypothetical protein IH951_11755 [Bacteroidetes bacterium]|nr:hypothetical protein [Bacteroidota bacterium]
MQDPRSGELMPGASVEELEKVREVLMRETDFTDQSNWPIFQVGQRVTVTTENGEVGQFVIESMGKRFIRMKGAPATAGGQPQPSHAQWNYERCVAAKGSVICGAHDPEKPLSWCKDIAGKRLKCVRIRYGSEQFFILDDNGQGTEKVWTLGGGPDTSHSSIPVDDPNTFLPEGANSNG